MSIKGRENASQAPSDLRRMTLPALSCRRDLQINPSRCSDDKVCGMFCTNAAVTEWKQFSKDAQSKALVQQRRTERGHVIQHILRLLKRHFRIYLLSLQPSVGFASSKQVSSVSSSRLHSTTGIVLQECSCVKLLIHIAKHIELLLYRSASSKSEYDDSATLLRRIQHFAMVMSCNARWKVRIVRKQEQVSDPSNKATQLFSPRRTLEEKKKRLWLFSPSRWKTNATYSLSASTTHKAASQGVLINANDRCYRSIIALTNVSKSSNSAVRIGSQSAPRCDHRELVTPSSKNTTGLQETFALSPFAVLFHGSYAPLLTQIFGYLSGASIIRNRILNKLCHTVLPQAITDLRISTIALTKLLKGLQSDRRVNGSSLLPKLQHLCVVAERIKQASSLPPRSIPCDNKRFSFGNSASHGTSNHSVVASSCLPQRSSSRTTSGELTITTLAHVLAANGCPQLRKLCLCSTFINSVSGNAVFHLTEALKAGCCRELEYLWLGGNALGDYGAMCVSHVIQANACPKLVLLDLRSNFIAQDGIRYLSTAFASLTEKCHIRQLCLGNNLITPTVLQVLLRCFRDGSMRELEFLGLDHNFLSRECLDALALQLVSGQCPQLRELCVGGNLGLSENDISSAFRDVADSAAGACWGLFRATYSAKSSSSLAEHEGGRRSKRQRRE